MSWMRNRTDEAVPNPENDSALDRGLDPLFEQALQDYRANVRAWSEAVYSRPRTQVHAARSIWRPTMVWTLGCVLVAGGLSGALYERHQRQEMAKLALQAREARQRQLAAHREPASDEDLLATVDSDISRDVPAAMQPLENLMNEDSEQ